MRIFDFLKRIICCSAVVIIIFNSQYAFCASVYSWSVSNDTGISVQVSCTVSAGPTKIVKNARFCYSVDSSYGTCVDGGAGTISEMPQR